MCSARRRLSGSPEKQLAAAALSQALRLQRARILTLESARGMIDDIRELEVLRGFRNLPRGDCEALAQAIRAMSLLAHIDSRSVSEAEINPLIVKAQGHGVVAVDGLVVFNQEAKR